MLIDTSPNDDVSLRDVVTDAIRYWEPRRLVYNGVLALIVIGYFVAYWPESREVVTFDRVLGLFVLAVLANVCYCGAYVADLFAQYSAFRALWRQWRWVVLVIGIAFAATLTHFSAVTLFESLPGG